GQPAVEFTWEGMDELDKAHGRGWAVLKEDGTLSGYLHFHMGDDSAFIAEPEQTHRPGRGSRGIGRMQARPRPPKGRQTR
ncbi:hypothetical protein, partial [Archangium sp.]|uniref:hypothetical protein n=1 Tax=Archangium sp. TaxID=1872627 RepID=UPI00286A9EC1